jgi:hypothetical protein
MSRTGFREHMTKEEAKHVKVGDVILVGAEKDRLTVVTAIYRRGVAPPYFGTTAERGFPSWRLAALPAPAPGEVAA